MEKREYGQLWDCKLDDGYIIFDNPATPQYSLFEFCKFTSRYI
jgi:hypothetical protein